MPFKDSEKRLEYRRQWRLKNLEHSRERATIYAQTRAAKVKALNILMPKRRGRPEVSTEHKRLRLRDANKKHKRKNTESNRIFIWDYKLQHPCKCGENDPACLIFHHEVEKGFSVSRGLEFSRKKLLQEIEKCVIMCANCHSKHHYYNRDVKGLQGSKNRYLT